MFFLLFLVFSVMEEFFDSQGGGSKTSAEDRDEDLPPLDPDEEAESGLGGEGAGEGLPAQEGDGGGGGPEEINFTYEEEGEQGSGINHNATSAKVAPTPTPSSVILEPPMGSAAAAVNKSEYSFSGEDIAPLATAGGNGTDDDSVMAEDATVEDSTAPLDGDVSELTKIKSVGKKSSMAQLIPNYKMTSFP